VAAGYHGLYIIRNDLIITGINDEFVPLTRSCTLDQNYPNPFNPVTKITYQLAQSGKVKLSIYDINGRLIETLVNGMKPSGQHSIEWHADKVSSGVYFYRLETKGYNRVKKMVVIK
jgi:hypothetical protein